MRVGVVTVVSTVYACNCCMCSNTYHFDNTRAVLCELESPSCVLHSLSVAVKMNHHQQVGNFLSHTPSPSRQTLPFHSSSQHNHFDITPSSEELDTQVRGGVTAECRLSASDNGVSVLC